MQNFKTEKEIEKKNRNLTDEDFKSADNNQTGLRIKKYYLDAGYANDEWGP